MGNQVCIMEDCDGPNLQDTSIILLVEFKNIEGKMRCSSGAIPGNSLEVLEPKIIIVSVGACLHPTYPFCLYL